MLHCYSKKLRVKVNTPLKVEVKKEDVTEKHLDEGRTFIIQAAIVRTLKMLQIVKHQDLLAEVFQQLSSRFKPSVHMIKVTG